MTFNRPRAESWMKESGIEALIAVSPANVTYLTGYSCWFDRALRKDMVSPGSGPELVPSYALLPLEGNPSLVLRPGFAANAMDLEVDVILAGEPPFGKLRLPEGTPPARAEELSRVYEGESSKDAVEAVARRIEALGLKGGRIGVEFDALSLGDAEALRNRLPGTRLMDASRLFGVLRMVKGQEEIQRLERSARINEQAGSEAVALAKPGLDARDLLHDFRYRVAREGADYDHFAFSHLGCGIATETRSVLESGMGYFIDFGCIDRHYFSDTGFTLGIGELDSELHSLYDSMAQSILAGEQALQPGVRASEVHSALQEPLAHLKGVGVKSFGHGIGLEPRDWPMILPDNGLRIQDDCIDVSSDFSLEEGMVLNLETHAFLPLKAGLNIEKTFVVTENGARPLIDQDRHRIVFPNAG